MYYPIDIQAIWGRIMTVACEKAAAEKTAKELSRVSHNLETGFSWLGEKSRVGRTTISAAYHDNRLLTYEKMDRLAQALGVSLDWIGHGTSVQIQEVVDAMWPLTVAQQNYLVNLVKAYVEANKENATA